MNIRRLTKPILLLGLLVITIFLGRAVKNSWLNHIRNNKEIQAARIHEQICENLVKTGQINPQDCVASTVPPDFIPVYFPTNQTNKEMVRQGMDGIQVLRDEYTHYSCKNGLQGSRLQYRLEGWNVNFAFCGDKLIVISYQN